MARTVASKVVAGNSRLVIAGAPFDTAALRKMLDVIVPIDLDRLSEAELVDLNHRVVERLRFIREARAHHAMLQLRIGERVAFEPDGRGRIEGVVTRHNRKSVSVLTADGQQWRVAPGLLRKVASEGHPSAPAPALLPDS